MTKTKTLPPLLREETYSYPDTVYEYFDETVRLDSVRQRDQIHLDGQQIVVWDRKTGTKWTELFRKNGTKILRELNETQVTVTRRRETQESRDAEDRAEKNRRILRDVLPHLERGDDDKYWVLPVKDVFTKIIDDKLEKGWLLQASDIEKILAENAEVQVRARWISMVEHAASGTKKVDMYVSDSPLWSGDLVDLMTEFIEKLKEELIEKYRQRSLSRSTSVVQNLMQDVENEVMAEFIDNATKWWRF